MARIDVLYLEDPCSGSRRMVDYLARDGIPISRDRVRNLMQRMGLWAIYQKPRTTVPGHPSVRFTCLVDLSMVTAVDQVWATDITYIPMRKGFLYLVAIVDLFSRNILSWKLSNSLLISKKTPQNAGAALGMVGSPPQLSGAADAVSSD
jgi:putative transposase